jgi:hypothetical protein
MSKEKEKKDPPGVDALVARVEQVVPGRSREEIRKELAVHHNDVQRTTSAFLDSA